MIILIFSILVYLFPGEVKLENSGYTVWYDPDLNIPVCTKHTLIKPEKLVYTPRIKFKKDTRIENCPNPSDYTGSGYDRGHMVPAADFQGSKKNDTFLMTNIAPQTPKLNRGAWKDVEEKLRNLSLKSDSIVIITGIIKGESKIKNKICIPDYFWKIAFVYTGKDYYILSWTFNKSGEKIKTNIQEINKRIKY